MKEKRVSEKRRESVEWKIGLMETKIGRVELVE